MRLPKSGRGGRRPNQRGGKRPGAGRPKGSRNKRTLDGVEVTAELGKEAIGVLRSLMRDSKTPPAVRATVCAIIADRVYGRPRQAVEVDINRPQFVFTERPMSPQEWVRQFGEGVRQFGEDATATLSLTVESSTLEH